MLSPVEDQPAFEIRFHGVRGSIGVSGPRFHEFGGATSCIEVRTGGHVMLFDAGTGIVPAGKALVAEGVTECALFLSHWHYDHVMGLPFFAPLYRSEATVSIWSGHIDTGTGSSLLEGLMRPPYFPVKPKVFRAKIEFQDFAPPACLAPFPGVRIRTCGLIHPGGATAYRIEAQGKVLSIVTDLEHDPGQVDAGVVEFVRGSDLLLYDSAFEDAEMGGFCGFGHSSWQQALRVATSAGVGRVGFIHHMPMRSDEELRRIEAEAQTTLPGAFAAREGGRLLL